jgi:hypothetical protein
MSGLKKPKPLTQAQLNALRKHGMAEDEVKIYATIKTKNLYLKDGDNPGGLLRLNEDGTISKGMS